MADNQAVGFTVFVLGKEAHENREVVVLNTGDLYGFSASLNTAYTAQVTKFPYTTIA